MSLYAPEYPFNMSVLYVVSYCTHFFKESLFSFAEGMRVLWEDYQKGTKQRRQLLVQRYGKKPFLGNVTDALSGQWIETNTKECPSCKVKIQVSTSAFG